MREQTVLKYNIRLVLFKVFFTKATYAGAEDEIYRFRYDTHVTSLLQRQHQWRTVEVSQN